jgi:DNA polymerase III sliding clamp (beta) subunit (PCNA family)
MIEVNRKLIQKALRKLQGVRAIHGLVELATTPDRLVLRAGDHECDLECAMAATVGLGDDSAGRVNMHLLSEIVNAMVTDTLMLERRDGQLWLDGGSKQRFELTYSEATLPEFVWFEASAAQLGGEALTTGIARVRHAVSLERREFAHVQLELGQQSRLVATDGFRFAMYELGEASRAETPEKIALTQSACALLERCLEPGAVGLEISGKTLLLTAVGWRLRLRCPETVLPDYRSVLPQIEGLPWVVDAGLWHQAIARGLLLESRHRQAHFAIAEGQLTMTTRGERGSCVEAVPVSASEEPLLAEYRLDQLREAIRPISGHVAAFVSKSQQLILRELGHEAYYALVQPMRGGSA